MYSRSCLTSTICDRIWTAWVDERGEALLHAHRRVRKASRAGVRSLSIDAHKPADVLGVFLYLPTPGLT